MDISKKYIKMCDKAEKLKGLWMWKSGDWVYCKKNHKIVVLYYNKKHGSPPIKYTYTETAIPLFRQDQLQEMVNITSEGYEQWHIRYVDFQYWYIDNEISCFDSMEQLWLAFVMYEKYQKIWDDEEEEWIIK